MKVERKKTPLLFVSILSLKSYCFKSHSATYSLYFSFTLDRFRICKRTFRNLVSIGVKTFVSQEPVDGGVRVILCTG